MSDDSAARAVVAKAVETRGPRAAALAAVVAFLSFLPALGAGFVYDDTLLIANNPLVQSSRGLLGAFAGHFWETQDLGTQGIGLTYYRPLVTLSFVLNWLAFDGAAWGFHAVSLALHALAVFLGTRIALRWLGRPWLAVLVGVLFAVHPTRSESVVWIAGRTDLLMSIFGLLAIELAQRARRSGRTLDAAWVALALIGALLCKEGAVVLPALLLADAFVDEPRELSRASWRILGVATTACGLYLLLRFTLLPVRHSHSAFLPAYGFMTVGTYAERLVWPWPQTFFYRNLLQGPQGIEYPWVVVAAGVAVCVAYAVGTWAALRRDRAAAAALVCAVLLIVPVLNFFETGIYVSVSDHFLYLPLLFLLLGVARALAPTLSRLPDRAFALTALGVGLVCLVPNTLRARDFEDDRTLWTHEIAINPDNPVALEWLSTEVARMGQPFEAVRLLARASQPAAQRHFLLAGKNADSGRHVRRVVLTAATTPDGDSSALRLLYEELESFAIGRPTGNLGMLGTLRLGYERGQALTARSMNSRGRGALHAELATIASRLGRLDDARRWLAGVDLEHPGLLPNPPNLVLVQARVGDYRAAFTSLERIGDAEHASIELQLPALERLGKRLLRAESLLEASRKAEGPRQVIAKALSQLELGSFLLACRELRAAYLQHPANEELAQLYTQALVSARLDTEAESVVTRALGANEARKIVSSLQRSLPPIQRTLAEAPADAAWWAAD